MPVSADLLLCGVRRRTTERDVALRTCLEVLDVAPESTAAKAGVAAGDFLENVNGVSAVEHGPECFGLADAEHCYGFASLARRERSTVITNGFPLGVRLGPTVAAIHERFDPRQPDFFDLKRLHEAGRAHLLEELTRALVPDRDGSSPDAGLGRNTPALALRAAAWFALGRKSAGVALAREYLEQFAECWTPDFAAVALHCLGMDASDRGDRRGALQFLRDAFAHDPSECTAKSLEQVDGVRPAKPGRWLSRSFPVRYTLASLLRPERSVSFAKTLRSLAPARVLTLCLLGTHRANGPYDDFMGRYRRLRRATKRFLGKLHVVTMQADRRAERPHWHREEDAAREEGVEMDVLLDADGSVTRAVSPQSSPEILVVAPNGVVVSEGAFDEIAVWKGVAVANALERAAGLA